MSLKKYIPLMIACGLFMENLDTTIISTAIPKMAISLGTNPINLKVALTSYLLSLAIFIPVSGWFADRFGSRKVFVIALTIFTFGSLCCAFSDDLILLIASRVIQGVGGALMMPVGRLILIKQFPKKELVRVLNYVALPALIGPALGPVLGGIIVSYFSWRYIFLVNIPVGLLGVYFSLKILPDDEGTQKFALDWLGFLLFGIGLASFSFAVQLISEPIAQYWSILLLIISAFLLMSYFWWSKNRLHPILNLAVFKVRTFKITVLGSTLSRIGISGIPFLLPLFFQLSLHKTPLDSGLLLLPYAIGMLLVKLIFSQILDKMGFKTLLIANTIVLGIALCALSCLEPHLSNPVIILITLLLGILTSLQFSAMNSLSYLDLSAKIASSGASIASTLQQLSMSCGISVSAIILHVLLTHNHYSAFDIPASIFHTAFLILGSFVILTSSIFLFLHKEDGEEAIHG